MTTTEFKQLAKARLSKFSNAELKAEAQRVKTIKGQAKLLLMPVIMEIVYSRSTPSEFKAFSASI